jgi:hypothetical protein
VIDEIHRAPKLFEVLRGIIDERRAAGERSGHYLLLGSAAIELMRQASESLAGRVAYVSLEPTKSAKPSVSGCVEAFRKAYSHPMMWPVSTGEAISSEVISYLDTLWSMYERAER